MAGGSHDHEDEPISGINVTPLVDIALVLLIIFMVTASFIVKTNIPLELPKAATSESSGNVLLSLAVTQNGKLFLNGKPGKLEDIPTVVAEANEKAKKEGKELAAFVSADRRAPYGTFARVVDRLRLAGVYDIAMDTKPEELEESAP